MLNGLMNFVKRPRFYQDESASLTPVSKEIPQLHYGNLFFISRYFLRALGSLIPPVSLKNVFYRWSGIHVGKRVFIGESVYFVDGFMSDLISLQDEAVLSPKVVLVAMAIPGKSFIQHKYSVVKTGRITVGKGAWLGAGCVVLPGVVIGEGAIVGANAVVTKDIPSYEVWVGNPARFIKTLSDYREI